MFQKEPDAAAKALQTLSTAAAATAAAAAAAAVVAATAIEVGISERPHVSYLWFGTIMQISSSIDELVHGVEYHIMLAPCTCCLILLTLQSRFGDKSLKLQAVCPHNGTALLKQKTGKG